jgi:hypothetical protein
MEIFFHVYLKSGYTRVLMDKFKKFTISGLYAKANKFNLILFGNVDTQAEFLNELKEMYPKIEYGVISNAVFNNEPDTLNLMIKKANEYTENTPMLYLHTKGLSYTDSNLKKNIDAWVRYLDLYVINKWEECVDSLKENDAAGGFFCDGDYNKHFQGNFWWANSDYIKNLPKIEPHNLEKYNRGEFWVLSETNKVYPVSDISPVDLYQNLYCNEADFPDGW